ncbi:MAG: transglutaminase-like domain-containing protein, partial [Pyrinomonadaceae bacterium]
EEGFHTTTMSNVHAFREEPRMAPEYSVRPWMLVYYSADRKLDPEKYWKDYGKRTYEKTKSLLKVNDDVRKAAAEIVGDAQTPEQKLERLFDYCRFKIKRIHDDASGFTAEQRAKMKENKSPADTLKRGMGTDIDIYNELRVKKIAAYDDADAGAVFGYRTTKEERSVFSQDVWSFQGRLPALQSRYTLTLPAGWRASGITFNHPNVEPTVNGSTYSWELRNLPPIEPEPASPSVSNLAPRVAVSYFTPPNSPAGGMRTFADWSNVSRWLSELHDPQAVPDEALAAKARALTAGAKTELERLRAIGHYVQNLQYISIDIGVGRGGGMRPRPAAQVFARSYGDCKDKANLMRAMLKAINIDAYPVIIYSGDPTYVREEWASPQQFNHCIIAVRVGDETQAPTVVTHPSLGRLLVF